MIFIYLLIAGLLLVVIATLIALRNFKLAVKRLFHQSPPVKKIFRYSQIEALPLPVKNYFRHTLKDGQPYVSCARLRHRGRFKTSVGAKWSAIRGEEYFTAQKPGFVWKGTLKGMTAVDSYIGGKGRLAVYFFRFFRIVNGSGRRFSQGELLRWLGECVWFPTALLPNENLTWEAIDDRHAKLVYHYKKLVVYYTVTFNQAHEITHLETRRYMGGKELETWIGKISNYKLLSNMMIPMTMRALWKLPDGEFTYAVFYLNDIEYDQPKIYR